MEPNVTTDQMHGITIQNSFFLGNAARWQPGHRRQPEFSGRCNLDHPSTTLRATGTIRAGRVGWVVTFLQRTESQPEQSDEHRSARKFDIDKRSWLWI